MRPIPMDEKAVSDQDVFSALNLSMPGLRKVKDALAQNDLALAKKELVHYFEHRTSPIFFYDYRKLPVRKIDTDSNTHDFQSSLGLSGNLKEFCLFAGNQLMNNIYVRPGRDKVTIHLGKHYENLPHFNYYEDQGKKHRTLSDIFVRGQIFEYLAILYHETEEKEVLEKFEEVLTVFFDHYPLVLEYTKPDASRFCLTEDRDVMSVGWLILTYISLFYTRIPYEISIELSFELIKRIWFLGIQFRRFDQDSYRKYNHHMWERGLVPYMLGLLFPEIWDFTPMKASGAAVIRQHIMDDFNEAGGYSEHSIPYWSGAALCEMLYRGISLAKRNKDDLMDRECSSRIRLTFQALALISPPQPLYSSIGDNGGPLVDPVLQIGIQAADDDYCREVLAMRHMQNPGIPVHTPLDYCDHRCGFFASRDNYGPKGNFVLMSAKTDCGDTGHNHMDMLSLCISFRGQEFIGEPYARPLYHTALMGTPQRGYLYNMESHNTVLAYGRPVQPNEMYAEKWGVYRPDSPVSTFTSLPDGCFVSAYHDAYTTCRHNRSVLFHRKGGLLILDDIHHGNRMPDPHIQRWNLMPDVSYAMLDDHTVLLEKHSTRLLCLWVGSSCITAWQKEDLYPEIIKTKDQLSTVLDVSFSADKNGGDIATVSTALLILDVTDKNIDGISLEKLESCIVNTVTDLRDRSDIPAALATMKTII